jgi:hypothetical protein
VSTTLAGFRQIKYLRYQEQTIRINDHWQATFSRRRDDLGHGVEDSIVAPEPRADDQGV